jgi:hypothetical protein
MADFPGETRALGPGGLIAANRSTSVMTAVASIVLTLSAPSPAIAASQGVPEPVISVTPRDFAGQRVEIFGGQLFEKIIVIPRSKALGFVLSAAEFSVEVWNAFRNTEQKLTAITINGSGGLTLANPYGLPLDYGALGSRIYQASVPIAGPAQINQDLVFTFLSGAPGADTLVTGSRITLFSIAPEWGEGMSESIEYLTDVLKAYSDNEQRRALRQLPRRALRYRALTLNARDAAGMESLVWGWQNQPYGVPWWPDAQPLLSDIAAGVFVIPVDTADRQFVAGGLVCVWVDEYTNEALTIVSVAPHAVTVSSPTQFAWKGGPGTRVLPVFLCRLPNSVEIQRYSSAIDQLDVQFIGEAQQPALAPSISPTQYRGFDVLEIAPNWEATLKRNYKRSLVTIDPKVGPIGVVDKGGTPIVNQDFPWWLDTHANVTAFRAFLLRRFGQLNPFWIPTWDQDLVLSADVGSIDLGIVVRSEFYSRFLFSSPARRYIAFIPIDGSGNVYRQITAAIDNGDGTESLTLDSATAKNFSRGATMVSFLTLARLASDRTEIKWNSSEHAESILTLDEVPRELP